MMALMLSIGGIAAEDFIAGSSIVSDLSDISYEDSTTIGGMISAISTELIEQTFYGSLLVWQNSFGVVNEDAFDIYAFPSGSDVDLNALDCTTTFQVSETDIDIRGVTSTWTTTNCESQYFGADTQDFNKAGVDTAVFDDGDTIYLDAVTSNTVTYDLNLSGIESSGSNTFSVCSGNLCPEATFLEDLYSLTNVINIAYVEIPELSNSPIIAFSCDEHTEKLFLISKAKSDLPLDLFVGFTQGYHSSAQSGQALMLALAGSYDIYSVI